MLAFPAWRLAIALLHVMSVKIRQRVIYLQIHQPLSFLPCIFHRLSRRDTFGSMGASFLSFDSGSPPAYCHLELCSDVDDVDTSLKVDVINQSLCICVPANFGQTWDDIFTFQKHVKCLYRQNFPSVEGSVPNGHLGAERRMLRTFDL